MERVLIYIFLKVLCNGPGTCVPICIAAYMLRILGITKTKIVFCESFACVDHISLSGKLLYPFVERFFVQWEELSSIYSKVHFVGRESTLSSLECSGNRKTRSSSGDERNSTACIATTKYALVTVGSTSFDQLVKRIDSLDFVRALQCRGLNALHIQLGRGEYLPKVLSSLGESRESKITSVSSESLVLPFVRTLNIDGTPFQVDCFRYKESLNQEIADAELIISHAGAGSILESFEKRKPIIVVPNELLMNNHQIQLAFKLSQKNFLFYMLLSDYTSDEHFCDSFKKLEFQTLRPFPSRISNSFSQILDEEMGFQS